MTKKMLHLEENGQASPRKKKSYGAARHLSNGLPEFYLAPTPLEQLLLNPLACATNAA